MFFNKSSFCCINEDKDLLYLKLYKSFLTKVHLFREIGVLCSFQSNIKHVPLMEEVVFIKNNVFCF